MAANRKLTITILGDTRDVEKSLKRLALAGKGFSGVGKTIAGAGIVGALGAIGAKAFRLSAAFDTTMRQIGAATNTPAAGMKELSDLAKKMGADTMFSAGQAAAAMLELSKAGMTAGQIKGGGIAATLKLAAAGNIELASASTVAANAMTMFGLKAEDLSSVADALAGGANASTASVESLALALSQVGPGAVTSGLSLQETVGVLSAFAQAGVQGSDAGTSLKTMLARLVPTTATAAKMMERFGLNFIDAKGAMLPIAAIAEQLKTKLGGLSQSQKVLALNTIFGTDASRAAAILTKEGAKGLEKYTKATNDKGAADKMAAARTDGAAGAMERMKGSLETAGISLGELLSPAVVLVAKGIEKLANGAQKLAEDPAIRKFGKVVQEWMGKAADAFKKVSKWVTENWPTVARVFGEVLRALQPFVDYIKTAFLATWRNLRDAWAQLEPMIRPLMPQLKQLAKIFGVVLVVALVGPVVAIAKLMQALSWMAARCLAVGRTVGTFVAGVISWFAKLPERVGLYVGQMAGKVKAWFEDTRTTALEKVAGLVGDVVGWFKGLPGKVGKAMGDFASTAIARWLGDLKAAIAGVKQLWESLMRLLGLSSSSIKSGVQRAMPSMSATSSASAGGGGSPTSQSPSGIIDRILGEYGLSLSALPKLLGAAKFATAQVGKPYKWGTQDCSWLVSGMLNAAGLNVGRMLSADMPSYGNPGKGALTVGWKPGHTGAAVLGKWFEAKGVNYGILGPNSGARTDWPVYRHPQLDTGAEIKKSGWAWVHDREVVLNPGQQVAMAGGGGMSVSVSFGDIYVEGISNAAAVPAAIARQAAPAIARAIAHVSRNARLTRR